MNRSSSQTAMLTTAMILLLAMVGSTVHAQEEPEAEAPPGATVVEDGLWGPMADGVVYEYLPTVLLTSDKAWCDQFLWAGLGEQGSGGRDACMEFLAWSPFPGRGEGAVVVLPETWARRIAAAAGWDQETIDADGVAADAE